jgi:hypothetical protein
MALKSITRTTNLKDYMVKRQINRHKFAEAFKLSIFDKGLPGVSKENLSAKSNKKFFAKQQQNL